MARKIVPVLTAAPAWMPDLSEYLVLWHGCTALDKVGIEKHGIDLSKCAVDTDFGRGFYTTTLERQARLWAWNRFYRWQADNPSGSANPPVVLRFCIRRYSITPQTSALDDGLDQLHSLAFVRGDYDNDDYWSLVQHCRQSTPGDPANGIADVVHDHRRSPDGWYQMVSGPIAAFWEQRAAMSGSDQFSFHEGGTYLLDALIRAGKGKGRGKQGDQKYYRWFPVT